MLLTYADSRGTDLKSWTETKEAPLRFLYHETLEYLEDADSFSARRKESQEELLKRVTEKLPQSHHSTAVSHFEKMPLRYFQRREASHISRHIKLLVDYFKDWATSKSLPQPTLHWREIKEQGCSEFTVIWQDQHKLASCLTGAFSGTKNKYYFRRIFLETMKLSLIFSEFAQPTSNQLPQIIRKNIEKLLVSGLHDEDFSYSELIQKATKELLDWHDLADQFPQRVYINNQSDEKHTLIEIQALDRIGLLHTILSVIAKFDLEVIHARITTTRGAAIDTIYVVDSEGKKITKKEDLDYLFKGLQKAIEIK